jgi:hypothetical protein
MIGEASTTYSYLALFFVALRFLAVVLMDFSSLPAC